jgi:hypothetical protein
MGPDHLSAEAIGVSGAFAVVGLWYGAALVMGLRAGCFAFRHRFRIPRTERPVAFALFALGYAGVVVLCIAGVVGGLRGELRID